VNRLPVDHGSARRGSTGDGSPQHPWLHGFGLGAAPAVIGLLGITAFILGRYAFHGWLYVFISGAALILALFTRVSPFLILIAGAVLGAVTGPLLTD
jgi:chromate transport protein ChrA